jgi:NDP-sugar pyrophosphorylase family protein
MIQEFVGCGKPFGMDVCYSFDGQQLLGTAGAIRKALPLLDTEFFALYGDSYLPCDYQAIASAFRRSGRQGLMTIYRNDGRFDTSNVEAKNGLIARYDKRNRIPSMRHIDYGIGVFAESVFKEVPENEFRDLAEIYQHLLASGDLAAYEIESRFYEIGSEQGIRDLEGYLAQQSSGADPGN